MPREPAEMTLASHYVEYALRSVNSQSIRRYSPLPLTLMVRECPNGSRVPLCGHMNQVAGFVPYDSPCPTLSPSLSFRSFSAPIGDSSASAGETWRSVTVGCHGGRHQALLIEQVATIDRGCKVKWPKMRAFSRGHYHLASRRATPGPCGRRCSHHCCARWPARRCPAPLCLLHVSYVTPWAAQEQ